MGKLERHRENIDPAKPHGPTKRALSPHAAGAFQTRAPEPDALPAPPARWSGQSDTPTRASNTFSWPARDVPAGTILQPLTPRTAATAPVATPATADATAAKEQSKPADPSQPLLTREQRRQQRRREKSREKQRHGRLPCAFGLTRADHSKEGWSLISSLVQLPAAEHAAP